MGIISNYLLAHASHPIFYNFLFDITQIKVLHLIKRTC